MAVYPQAAASLATASAAHRALLLSSASFSTSGSALSESLQTLLKRELKHEQTSYEQPEAVAKGPPAPFTLTSAPGDGTVTLKRDYNGEEVSVDASINMQEGLAPEIEDEAEEEAEDYGTEVAFNVTVTKGGESLVFECASDGTYLEVRHVALEPADGPASETAYSGPVFDELADPLREAFSSYLADRGIDEDLGEYLRHAVYDKEQKEYIGWLDRVGKFVGN